MLLREESERRESCRMNACKMDGPACKLLNYISGPRASAALCLQLSSAAWMPHHPAQLVFLRDEEESVSALSCDRRDDWNINGQSRAEHQQPGGCAAAILNANEHKHRCLYRRFQLAKVSSVKE